VYHLLDASHAYLADTLPADRTVATVHDLIPSLQALGHFPVPRPGWAARWLIRRSLKFVRRVDAIATVSQSTANDLAAFTGRQADAVIHLPLRAEVSAPRAQQHRRGAKSNRQLEVLHVGNNGFYKNRNGVLRIFAAMRARQPKLNLTMAGPPPDAAQTALLETLGLNGCVHYAVNPTDDDIQSFYQHAGLLLFPSLYEGYGWPPLEALQQGCPVVCAHTGSLPEVVGDAALFADPTNTEQFAMRALRVLNEPELAAALLERGRTRLAGLTLERMASQLLTLYRKVAAAR
jgi:glycosyltransferase involved in cell wall biosynthesis